MKEQIEELTNELIRTSRCGTHSAVAEYLYNKGWRKQSEWISVTERLPEKTGTYLVYTKKGHIEIDIFDVGYYWVELEDCVTHWMPMPQPPEMKGGAE